MISNAKKFKVENHSKVIFNEDKEYLKQLNNHLDE
jgi:hypothetical protein